MTEGRPKVASAGHSMRELIGKADTNKVMTRSQGTALLRHRKHHTEGHMLLMLRLMTSKHMSFKDAHEHAMTAVGR